MSLRTKKPTDKFYDKRIWRDTLRPMTLRRHPLCAICLQNNELRPEPSVIADHIIPFADAANAWELFTDLNNLRGLCKRHHDERTATECGGFGNRSNAYIPQRKIAHTGATGNQFISGSLPQHVLDRALGGQKALDELLKDLPE